MKKTTKARSVPKPDRRERVQKAAQERDRLAAAGDPDAIAKKALADAKKQAAQEKKRQLLLLLLLVKRRRLLLLGWGLQPGSWSKKQGS